MALRPAIHRLPKLPPFPAHIMALRAKINSAMLPVGTDSIPGKAHYSSFQPTYDPNDVLFTTDKGIHSIVLNRPTKLNCIDQSMISKIIPQLVEWTEAKDAKMVVVKGAGHRALCAGGDVTALAKDNFYNGSEGAARSTVYFRDEYYLNHLLATYPKPFVSVMNGITMGGGVGISVHAPFRIITEKTMFAMPEADIGFFPDVGGTYFLPRLDGESGVYLGLTSTRLKGYDAYAAGVGTHFISESLLPEVEARLAEVFSHKIATTEDAFELVNAILMEFESPPPEGYKFFLTGATRKMIDYCFSRTSAEEIAASLLADGSPIALAAHKAFLARSPTSVKVTLAAMRRARHLGIREALEAELRLAENFMYGREFIEGVNAKLISKPARPPKWNPPTLERVSEEIVHEFLGHRPNSVIDGNRFLHPEHNGLYPRHHYGLPAERHIHDYIVRSDDTGKPFHVSAAQVLAYFVHKTRGKYGVREKVQEVIDRKTRQDPTNPEFITWVYE